MDTAHSCQTQRRVLVEHEGNALVKYENGMLSIKRSCTISEIGLPVMRGRQAPKWMYQSDKRYLKDMLVE